MILGFVKLIEKLGDRRTHLLRVLTYHRVAEPDAYPDLYPNLIGATPDEFDGQMRFLAAHYRGVSMQEVLKEHAPEVNDKYSSKSSTHQLEAEQSIARIGERLRGNGTDPGLCPGHDGADREPV